MHVTLDWTLLVVCHTEGATAAAACSLQLFNLHARKSFAALLLMLLYVCCMSTACRLFVVGLPLLLLAFVVNICINTLAMSFQRSRCPAKTRF